MKSSNADYDAENEADTKHPIYVITIEGMEGLYFCTEFPDGVS